MVSGDGGPDQRRRGTGELKADVCNSCDGQQCHKDGERGGGDCGARGQ